MPALNICDKKIYNPTFQQYYETLLYHSYAYLLVSIC